MSKIIELQIIFQKPIEEDMVPYIEDLYKELMQQGKYYMRFFCLRSAPERGR